VSSASLEHRIGHTFEDPGLLRRALSHRSWSAEHPTDPDNERLEFLGDAVLGWAVADIVYHRFGGLAEGALSDLRKSVVNAGALADVARELGIGDHVLLGRGEDSAGGRGKDSILSDAMEAVIGAVYLDGGAAAAFALVGRLFEDRLDDVVDRLDQLDHKTALQELVARLGRTAPVYRTRSTGPDHDKTFHAVAEIDGEPCGDGVGRTKKAAEQIAAAVAHGRLSADA